MSATRITDITMFIHIHVEVYTCTRVHIQTYTPRCKHTDTDKDTDKDTDRETDLNIYTDT